MSQTKCLKQLKFISHVLEVGETKIKMPADLVPDENSTADLQMTDLLINCSSHGGEKKERDLSFFFHKAPILLDLGPALTTSFSYFLMASSSNTV